MGIVRADIGIKNPRLPESPPLTVRMLADSGSVHLCIPESLRAELELENNGTKTVVLADGSRREYPYAGPVELRFGSRVGYTGAIVMGNEPLLGAIPMEDMDLVVLPKERKLAVNPQSPNSGISIAKGGGGF